MQTGLPSRAVSVAGAVSEGLLFVAKKKKPRFRSFLSVPLCGSTTEEDSVRSALSGLPVRALQFQPG